MILAIIVYFFVYGDWSGLLLDEKVGTCKGFFLLVGPWSCREVEGEQ